MRRVGLQSAPKKKGHICVTYLCSLEFGVSLQQCRTHPYTVDSSLLLCMLFFLFFLTLETPTVTIWPAFQLQRPPCLDMLRFKCDGPSNTTSRTFPCLFMRGRRGCFHTSSLPWLCWHSSNELDLEVNCVSIRAKALSVKTPWSCYSCC